MLFVKGVAVPVMREFNYESCSAVLIFWEDGRVFLSNVFSKERRNGHATVLLEILTEYADENMLDLSLRVMAYGEEPRPNSVQLKAFYERFGFVAEDPTRVEYIHMHRKFVRDLA